MDFELSDLITRCQSIVDNLPSSSDEEKIDMLQDLAEIFIFAGQDLLSAINSNKLIVTLLNCFKNSDNNRILDFSSTSMVNFIDTFNPRSSIFLSNDAVPLLAEKFDKGLNQSVMGNCIKILKFLVDKEPELIGKQFGVLRLLKVFDTLRLADQRSAMHCIASMYGYNLTHEIAEYIPRLCMMLNSNDKFLQSKAVSAIIKMVPAIEPDDLKFEMMSPLQEYINNENDLNSLEKVLKVLMEASKKVAFAQLIINSNFDFSRVLSDQFAKSKEIPNKVLNLLLNIFPPAEFPPDFWDKPHDLANGLKEYSEKVIKYALPFFKVSSGNENLLLALMCVCQRLSPSDYPPEIFDKVSTILQELSLTPFALLFTLTANEKYDTLIVSSGIFTQLKYMRPKQQELTSWYEEKLAFLTKRIGSNITNTFDGHEFKTIEELIEFMESHEFTPFEFEEADIAEKAYKLLNDSTNYDNNNSFNIQHHNNIKNLLEFCKRMTINTPVPCPTDIHNDREPSSFAKGLLNLQIVIDGELDENINIGSVGLFVGIEAWYNKDIRKISNEAYITANPDLAQIIQAEHTSHLSFTEIGLLHRAFKTPGYKRFKFKMNGVIYSYLDYIFQSFVRSLEKPSDYQVVVPKIELIEETEEEGDNQTLITTLTSPEFQDPKTTNLLDLISLIHQKFPDLDYSCPELEKRLRRQTTFFNTVGRFTPATKLVPNNPFLFSQDFRILLYKLTSLDLFSALSVANSKMFHKSESLLEGKTHFMCRVRRDHILEDGITLLNSVGPGCVQFDISFDNEPGFGSGPMHEFIALMSAEFSKKSLKMWRITKESTDDIIIGENGYFPSPGADPELFYTLGILCAKALQAGIPIPISFNTEFFKFLRDEPINVNYIDSRFFHSLLPTYKDGFIGLPFVYPGIESIELIPNGSNIEVTSENSEKYINLVREFSIEGPQMKSIRKRFLDGFHKIVLNGMEKILSAEEMNYLISGDKIQLSMDELMDNIVLEHGYNSSSPEIKMLFEAILEMDDQDRAMFFKFVTGTERLPIGGLSNLSPKVRVAKRVLEAGQKPDDALPTVSTCSYYFKMPPYSNKETLLKKIKLAIHEGQNSFLLS